MRKPLVAVLRFAASLLSMVVGGFLLFAVYSLVFVQTYTDLRTFQAVVQTVALLAVGLFLIAIGGVLFRSTWRRHVKAKKVARRR